MVKDPKKIDVKYVSFASNDGARVLYFYNCDDEKAAASLLPPPAPHALFAGPIEYDEDILAKKCKHVHAWEDKYSPAIKLEAIKNSKPDGYLVQLPIFVKGVRDAHILLTTGNNLDPKDGYEIVIGGKVQNLIVLLQSRTKETENIIFLLFLIGWGDTKHLIRKNGDVVAKVNEFNVLNEQQPIKVIVELKESGELLVFTDDNKSVPLLEFKDKEPIKNLNTLSFTAYYRDLDFYYGCSA